MDILKNTNLNKDGSVKKLGCEIRDYTVAPVFMKGKAKGKHEWLIEFKSSAINLSYFSELLDNALKSLNFKKYCPKLICIEIHNSSYIGSKTLNLKSVPVYKFLLKKGYQEVWKNGFSFIFSRK